MFEKKIGFNLFKIFYVFLFTFIFSAFSYSTSTGDEEQPMPNFIIRPVPTGDPPPFIPPEDRPNRPDDDRKNSDRVDSLSLENKDESFGDASPLISAHVGARAQPIRTTRRQAKQLQRQKNRGPTAQRGQTKAPTRTQPITRQRPQAPAAAPPTQQQTTATVPVAAPPQQTVAPDNTSQLRSDKSDFIFFNDAIIDKVNNYYKKPYPRKSWLPKTTWKDPKTGIQYEVHRPNHGLLHAMRKAALAFLAVKELKDAGVPASNWVNYFTDPNSVYYNKNFAEQLAFGMLMLRTGRTTESNDWYKEDNYQSAKYFVEDAPSTGIFPRQKDIDDFEFALQTIGDQSKCFDNINDNLIYTDARGCNIDRYYIYNFLYGIHHLDLRRLTSFDEERILNTVATYLTFQNPKHEKVLKLWEHSGDLLALTGDSDMRIAGSKTSNYRPDFYYLSHDPKRAREKIEHYLRQFLDAQQADKQPAPSAQDSHLPTIVQAQDASDDFFPYIKRPKVSDPNIFDSYSKDVINKIPQLTLTGKAQHIPWTFRYAENQNDSVPFALNDVVVERVFDKESNKNYLVMYHGTTDDLLDVFSKGAENIAFNVASKMALGPGFYLTANPNEAKFYSCLRLKDRIQKQPGLKGLVLVVGIEEDPNIMGMYSTKKHLSNKEGEPINEDIYFKRNGRLQNQFVFYTNIKDKLKIFKLIVLDKGFETSLSYDDKDGHPRDAVDTTGRKGAFSATCDF